MNCRTPWQVSGKFVSYLFNVFYLCDYFLMVSLREVSELHYNTYYDRQFNRINYKLPILWIQKRNLLR